VICQLNASHALFPGKRGGTYFTGDLVGPIAKLNGCSIPLLLQYIRENLSA
jgi:hypothetical protein